MKKTFQTVSPKISFPELEEEILAYWKKNKIFEKSIEHRPVDKPWTFLDGPPFVTGMPHYGHLLGSIHKDVFGRYWTMKGYRVPRLWGWDGHGLPIENKVENKLEIKRKKDIEDVIGVKRFIEECKLYVDEISGEWEWYVDHIGRWVDFKNAYKTWDKDYMESVMWVFKQMYDKKHIYKGLKVTLYCPHCATPISNFEVAMDADNYKEISDAATTYKYKVVGEGNTYILAWSTTPWNKIVTPALAVNPKLQYVKVQQGNENYILAKSTLKTLANRHPESRLNRENQSEESKTVDSSAPLQNDTELPYTILEEMKGSDLIGMKFEPHYDYYPIEPGEKAFEVIGGDFVTADEGTGVVTIAAYGEEDLIVMRKENVHIEMHLDEEGTIKPEVPKFGGMYYLKANKAVNADLAERGLIYHDETVPHNVPLCWRCHTRLYYAPINAWYVDIQKLKPLLLKTNEEVNWVPKHFKYGRFQKSLENAPDWNISRNRYWGSPVPVWECECGERFVPGSIKELEEASGKTITDLHKPEIDEVKVPCKKCGKQSYRVPEVLDSWIEAGSAAFAERHFPFDSTQKLEDFYPPDFIAEYTGQIRAWFYVQHVIGGALYESKAFKNVGVEGVILGTDGRKMSKNLGNYPDPKELLQKYGGDALRLYLMSSSIMNGEDMVISEEHYRNQVRGMMLILWNVYNFFINNATVDEFDSTTVNENHISENVLDTWINVRLNETIKAATESLNAYDTVHTIDSIQFFVTDLSTWYVRRSRDRVGIDAVDISDKNNFYITLYTVLVTLTKLIAPIAPFISESIFRNLTGKESVHLEFWPEYNAEMNMTSVLHDMDTVRSIVEIGLAHRKLANIKVKQPLQSATILIDGTPDTMHDNQLNQLILDELNVKKLNINEDAKIIDIKKLTMGEGKNNIQVRLNLDLTEDLIKEGEAREIMRLIQGERKNLGLSVTDTINVELKSWPKEFEKEIKKKTNITNLSLGDTFKISKVE